MKKHSQELKPPSEISPDGREVWDWAARLGQQIHRESKLRELHEGIRDLNPKCGTCYFWMKSSLCPRETQNNGRRSGPSMNGHPCEKHQEEQWVTELRENRKAEIESIQSANGVCMGRRE